MGAGAHPGWAASPSAGVIILRGVCISRVASPSVFRNRSVVGKAMCLFLWEPRPAIPVQAVGLSSQGGYLEPELATGAASWTAGGLPGLRRELSPPPEGAAMGSQA